jgi:UDP-N-acetylglucosamine 2-epimerase (non-hydrolysing)
MKVLICFGTRPEAIKMAPVIEGFTKSLFFDVYTLNTGQHLELMQPVLELFNIKPSKSLGVMKSNDTLENLFSRILLRSSEYMRELLPDIVLVHGDTSTTLAVALAAFYLKIPIAHVEAGLRSFDMNNPFPEEMNRVLLSKLASYHFAPTTTAKNNLLTESVPEEKIQITGNTVIDAINIIRPRIGDYVSNSKIFDICEGAKYKNKKIVYVTCHRRENQEKGLKELCEALIELSSDNELLFIFVLHMSPVVRDLAIENLKNIENIKLVEPVGYIESLYLLSKSYFVLTDSGGLQEEAPVFGAPVLVLRETTERPEGIDAGVAKLVGCNKRLIVEMSRSLLAKRDIYDSMSKKINPYGDGFASEKIVHTVKNYFIESKP